MKSAKLVLENGRGSSTNVSAPAARSDAGRERAKQVFRFLKAYVEREQPTRRQMSSYEWSFWLRDIPQHPSISRSQVALAADTAAGAAKAGDPLLTIRRPKTTRAPVLPDILIDWIEPGRDDPNSQPRIVSTPLAVRC